MSVNRALDPMNPKGIPVLTRRGLDIPASDEVFRKFIPKVLERKSPNAHIAIDWAPNSMVRRGDDLFGQANPSHIGFVGVILSSEHDAWGERGGHEIPRIIFPGIKRSGVTCILREFG